MGVKTYFYLSVIASIFLIQGSALADTAGLVQAQQAYFDGLKSGKYTTQAQKNALSASTIGAAQEQYDRAQVAQWKNAIKGAAQPGAYHSEVVDPSLWQSFTKMLHLGKGAPKDDAANASNTVVAQPANPQASDSAALDSNGIPRYLEFGRSTRSPASK
jgi:hypothetical protein